MSALIWMLSWLPTVLPAAGTLPPPINVTLTSLNFTFILNWEAGPGTPEGVHYKVTYMCDRHSWEPVSGCERVQKPLVCNLTAVFCDLMKTYYMRVTAHLGGEASPAGSSQYEKLGFRIISQLSLPLLSVTPKGRDLIAELQPPMERLRKHYELLRYEFQIRSSKDKPENITIQSLAWRWENLAPGRRYCVAVRFNDNILDFYSGFSQPQCAAIPTMFPKELWILGPMCLMVIFIVVFVVMLVLTGFICLKRRPLPSALTSIQNLEEVWVHDHCTISSLLKDELLAPSAGGERSSCSSSDESDEHGETESAGASVGAAYTQRVGAHPLSSSSSSSCQSQPKPLADLSSNQLPSSQPGAQISTGSPSRAGPELSTDCGGRPTEEEAEAQDVNLLTLTFGRVEQEEEEDEEEEEKSDLSVQQMQSDPRPPMDAATEAVREDEEEEEASGYMGRPGV